MTVNEQTAKNNGHGFTPDGFNPGTTLRPGTSGGDDKIIMETGKEERALYFKADFYSQEEVKATLLAYREAEKFNIKWLMNLIKDKIAADTSVKAKRTNMFVTLKTGVWLSDNRLRKAMEKDAREQDKAQR